MSMSARTGVGSLVTELPTGSSLDFKIDLLDYYRVIDQLDSVKTALMGGYSVWPYNDHYNVGYHNIIMRRFGFGDKLIDENLPDDRPRILIVYFAPNSNIYVVTSDNDTTHNLGKYRHVDEIQDRLHEMLVNIEACINRPVPSEIWDILASFSSGNRKTIEECMKNKGIDNE